MTPLEDRAALRFSSCLSASRVVIVAIHFDVLSMKVPSCLGI